MISNLYGKSVSNLNAVPVSNAAKHIKAMYSVINNCLKSLPERNRPNLIGILVLSPYSLNTLVENMRKNFIV